MTPKTPSRWTFYLAMACVYALITAVGFSRRYFLPVAAGTFEAPAIVHVHGIIMFGWIAFVILQSLLVATGRTALHRGLGRAGIALGTLLVYTATQIAILLLARELRGGGPSPREFAALLMSSILLIASLFGSAIATVNKPEIHKRLMTLAILVILTPALARIIQLIDGALSRLARNDLAGIASDILILFVVIYDARKRGKPHPAYLAGGACIVLVQIGSLLVRSTPAWYGVANWLAGLAR